jgi:uncharacterized protein YkwD
LRERVHARESGARRGRRQLRAAVAGRGSPEKKFAPLRIPGNFGRVKRCVPLLSLALAATAPLPAAEPVPIPRHELVIAPAGPPLALKFTAAEIAAALLAETNRVRLLHGREPLAPLAKLNGAADDQCAYLALAIRTAHDNVIPGQQFPADRVRARGLYPALVAENVLSMSFAGVAEPPATCAALAAEFVARWMESPVHRRNLLSPDMTHLGGATRRAKLPGGTERFYGVQVFAAF